MRRIHYFLLFVCFANVASASVNQDIGNEDAVGEPSKQLNNYGLTKENLNPNVKRMEYILGGTCAPRANEIEHKLKESKDFPFKELIRANIGDLQGGGSPPMTFFKQVISLVHYPELGNLTNYPLDVKERAEDILNECQSKTASAYTADVGLNIVRKHVAEFITRRDNVIPAKMENIILCAGSTNCVRVIFKLFADQCKPNVAGIMLSYPLYSLFSAAAAENGLFIIDYHSKEEKNWEIELDVLNNAITNGRRFSNPRIIFIINPSNPTGVVLTRENIETIIKFANKEKLVIVTDEIYQDNIYTAERPFVSFRKVMFEMDKKYQNTQLISVHSISKGYMGETGVRSGYIELVNFDKAVRDLIEKSISTTFMPSVLGQAMLSCYAKPPVKGQASYELYQNEKTNIINYLSQKAKIVTDGLNSIPGITCTPFYGAMSIFAKITMPAKAIQAAKDRNQTPDVFFSFELLETNGVVTTPGSDFAEATNTYHIRISNLPSTAKIAAMLERIKTFNAQFLKKYE